MENSQSTYRVIISGGGTGGHIYPAIAIANELKSRNPLTEILFVGALGRMEMEKVPKAGYEIIGLPIAGIQRRFTLKNLLVPFKLIKSMFMAKKIVKDFKPDLAIGVGGYASGPLLKAAVKLGVPALLQEQNSFAGLTNKLLAKDVESICVAYEGMESFFPKEKIKITGNPVRKDIINTSVTREGAISFFGLDVTKKTVLVIGGSLGARTINESIKLAASELESSGFQVLWQTGAYYYESLKELGTKSILVKDFIYEMDKAYAAADVVVSRAGALSVSELCLVGKPSILVPSPNVSEDHQTKNAMALVNKGAAVLVKDVDADSALKSELLKLLSNDEVQKTLAVNIKGLAKPQATDTIVDEAISIMSK